MKMREGFWYFHLLAGFLGIPPGATGCETTSWQGLKANIDGKGIYVWTVTRLKPCGKGGERGRILRESLRERG